MKFDQVVKHFGSVKSLCEATGLTHQAVYYWRRVGKVSQVWQYRLQELTKGKLKVNGDK